MERLKIPLIVILAVTVTLALLLIVREFVPATAISVNISAWEIFFAVFGVIYAIIVGLILVEVLRRHHALSTIIRDELNAVADIRDFLIYVKRNIAAKTKVKKALLKYVNSVVRREWKHMEKDPEGIDSDNSEELEELMAAVHQIKTSEESECFALNTIIEKIADVATYRTTRLELCCEGLCPALQALIVSMSVILVAALLLMDIESVWIHGLMAGSVAAAVSLLFLVLDDLNRPFSGLWQIKAAPFRKMARRLRKAIEGSPNTSK